MKTLGGTVVAALSAVSLVGLLSCRQAGETAGRAADVKWMTYPLEHPAPMFKSYTGGMPTTVRLASQQPEPPVRQLRVPCGATNVAARKTVRALDGDPITGELSFATDGRKSGKDDTILELAPGKQWLQIDLAEPCEVYAIAMWRHPYTWAPHVYRDVVVLLSDDEQCTKNVRTIFNNDHDNTLGLGKGGDFEYYDEYGGKVIPCLRENGRGPLCRYVRVWSNGRVEGNDGEVGRNQYVEVEVIGRPASGKPTSGR